MNTGPQLSVLLSITRRRLVRLDVERQFRRLSWVSAILLAGAGLVHFRLHSLSVPWVLAGSIAPTLVIPLLFCLVNRPDDGKTARYLDQCFQGRGLAATAVELCSHPSPGAMARYVLDQAETACSDWRKRPELLPVPGPWPRAWMPLALASAGIFTADLR